jgi:prophage regulatory protein
MRNQTPARTINRYVSPRLLRERLGLSEATILRMRRRGQFPQPIRLSPGRVGWRESDIVDWLDARAEASERAMQASR